MSKDKNPHNKDFNNNIININNRKKFELTLDISKSTILTRRHSFSGINRKLSPLQYCRRNKSLSPTVNYGKTNLMNKTNLNTNSEPFNMTIKNILESIRERRTLNSQKYEFNLNVIKKTLDGNKSLDVSNNQIVTYKPEGDKKTALNDFLRKINKEYEKISNDSSLFQYETPHYFQTKSKKRSLYYPPPVEPPPPPPRKIEKKKVNIQVEIECLDDLLKLIEDYPLKYDIEYNINMRAMHNIKSPLLELKNMVGMNRLKNSIVDQILYFIQEFHKNSNAKNQDFMHTVIYGPPGTGKTEVAKIMGSIFSKLGILSRKYFKKATRSDLIAGYLGQTALKTRDVIKECKGGVLFIDEAYALGNAEKRDSFSKECIDTLCEALSDNKDNLMVIIAGYEKELKNCFFAYNQGLDSRFTWRFHTDDYKYEELFLIFKKKVYDIDWELDDNIKKEWFQNKMDDFAFFGRDVETLLAKVKIAHGRRVFCLPLKEKKKITLKDLNKGFDMFLINKDKDRNDEISKTILSRMYC